MIAIVALDNISEDEIINELERLINTDKKEEAILFVDKCFNKIAKRYYDFILLVARLYKKCSLYKKAIKILENELSMPYIPLKYETLIKEAYKDILFAERDTKKTIEVMSEESLEDLFKNAKSAIDISYLFSKMANFNFRPYINFIKDLLVQEDVENGAKTLLLAALKDAHVCNEVIVKKNGLIFEVDIGNLDDFRDDLNFIECNAKLDEYSIYYSLNIIESMKKILILYYMDIFPDMPSGDDLEAIIEALKAIANEMYECKFILNSEISENLLQYYKQMLVSLL